MSLKRLADNALELVGSTPMVRLKTFEAPTTRIYAKYEAANPGGSVKDRIALNMLLEAERSGKLKAGQGVVVEPTSGNTGVGLAMACAVRGYQCILIAPEGLPLRRQALLKAYGAELRLTPFELGMKGAVDEAERLRRANPSWFCPMQFANRSNPAAHRKGTAQEILRALKAAPDAFVAGVGTGGTLTGCGEALRKKNPKLWLAAVEPEGSPVLSGGEAGTHKIQGIGAGFVPAVLRRELISEIIKVADADALGAARQLARREGLLVGISSGANAFAAGLLAKRLGRGKVIVTVLCDRGEPYLNEQGDIE